MGSLGQNRCCKNGLPPHFIYPIIIESGFLHYKAIDSSAQQVRILEEFLGQTFSIDLFLQGAIEGRVGLIHGVWIGASLPWTPFHFLTDRLDSFKVSFKER